MRTLFAIALCLTMASAWGSSISIQGLDSPLEKNVRAWLSLAKLEPEAPRREVLRRYRRSRGEIEQALRVFGYYNPHIETGLEWDEEEAWRVTVSVEPGPRTQIDQVEIRLDGPSSPSLDGALAEGQSLVGRPLDHRDYGALKDRILNQAFRSGFLDARYILSELRVDPDTNTAVIELELATGLAFEFGVLEIRQDILDDDFLQRYVDIREGDAFDAERLLNLQLRLTDLDYFSALDIETQRSTSRPERIDVTIAGTPRASQRYQFGLGYGTDTGPRFTIANEFRRLNRRGHRLRNDLRLSEVLNSLTSQYLIPAGTLPGEDWSLKGRVLSEELGSTRTDNYQIGLARTRIQDSLLWQHYLNWEREFFTFEDRSQSTTLLMPGTSVTVRRSDNALNPRSGLKVFLDLHGADENLLSTASFVQFRINARIIVPVDAKSRVLMRGEFGYTVLDEFSKLPASQRFFAGGDQSVRGYAYRSLAPRNASGEVIGGDILQTGSVEVDRLFYKSFGAAAFVDVGAATENLTDRLNRSYGVGLRWRTVIGMVRFDVGFPLDEADAAWRIHIGIGGEL